jgi:hypothetical protein
MRGLCVAAVALASCGGVAKAPCTAAPTRASADEFVACGGLVYHGPPGNVAGYTIRFVNKASLALQDLCVLVDGLPIHTDSEVAEWIPRIAAGKPMQWNGRLFAARHTVHVQLVYGAAQDARVTLRTKLEIFARTGSVLELTAVEQDGKLSLTYALPNDPKEARTCE